MNNAIEGSNLSKSLINNMGPMNELSGTQVLWGTTINTSTLQNSLKEFLTTFTAMPGDDDDQNFNIEPYYISVLKQLAITEELVLDIDCRHLFDFNRSLYRQLIDYPTDVIPIFDLVASSVAKENQNYNQMMNNDNYAELENQADQQIIQVRPFNLQKSYQIRELDPSHIDKLI